MDDELYSQQFSIEHKMFYVDLKSNSNGQYLKISEKSGGRRHNVLIPASGLEMLADAVREAREVADSNPDDAETPQNVAAAVPAENEPVLAGEPI